VPPQSSPLAGRAVLAVTLLAGFYVLAVGISAALVALPVAIPHVPAKLVIVCWIGAAVILWSIVPRIDRFEAPGPRLAREDQPRLHAEIDAIAAATGQEPPEDVYVVNEVNAFVTERGGWMGFGSKRVMGVGLPLLSGLDVTEMRAVIAHEFGHFHGGDTKLGPWIYKTRGAIGRTVENLVKRDSLLLHKPFLWYGNMFLRLTQSISRAQEFAADRLAAEVVGPGALAGGLRKLPRLAPGFERYFEAEYVPVVNAGLRPPLLAGFQAFLDEPSVRSTLTEIGAHAEAEASGGLYDSHPPLKARIDALQGRKSRDERADTRPATALLDDVERVELELLAFLARGADVSSWPVIHWDEVCERVVIPSWENFCRDQASALSGLRVRDLAALAREPDAVRRKLALGKEQRSRADEVAITQALLDRALGLALRRRGWALATAPGASVVASKGSETLAPLGTMQRLAEGGAAVAEWQANCARLEIADLPLDAPPA